MSMLDFLRKGDDGENEEELLQEEYRRCIKEIRWLRKQVDKLRNEVESLRALKSKIGEVKQATDRHRLMIDSIKRRIDLQDKAQKEAHGD